MYSLMTWNISLSVEVAISNLKNKYMFQVRKKDIVRNSTLKTLE